MATQEGNLARDDTREESETPRRGARTVLLGAVDQTPTGEELPIDQATLGRELEDMLQSLAAQTADAVGERLDALLVGNAQASPDARFTRGVILGIVLTLAVFVVFHLLR